MRVFLIVLFWVTPWALADNTAQVLNGPEASAAPDPGYYARDCARVYKEADCAGFFKENPELGKYAIDCNKPISPATELKKCGAGAWEGTKELAQFIAGVVTGVPSAIQTLQAGGLERQRQLENFEICSKSDECKFSQWEEATQKPITEQWKTTLRKITSGPVLERVIHQSRSFAQRERSEEARKILISEPASPERDQKLEKLIPGWTERQNAKQVNLWNIGLNAGQKLLKKAQCYDREVQAEAMCYGLASLAVPGAAIKGISKFPRLAEIAGLTRASQANRIAEAEKALGRRIAGNSKLEDAIERAHEVGRGEIGRDGTAAKIGNYTDEQLRRKAEILRAAGFDEAERRALIEAGVVGSGTVTSLEAQAALRKLDHLEGERIAASGKDFGALRESIESCIKKNTYNSNCAANVARVDRAHSEALERIGKEANGLSEKLEEFAGRAHVTAERERAEALWLKLAECQEKPALPGCTSAIAESNSLLGLNRRIPQRGPGTTAATEALLTKQMRENTLYAQRRAGDLDFLPEQVRNSHSSNLVSASGSRQARDRFIERSRDPRFGADWEHVSDFKGAVHSLVGPNARAVNEGSKAALISADGRLKVVFDPVDKYFTVQELSNGAWKYNHYTVRDGALIPNPIRGTKHVTDHFKY